MNPRPDHAKRFTYYALAVFLAGVALPSWSWAVVAGLGGLALVVLYAGDMIEGPEDDDS